MMKYVRKSKIAFSYKKAMCGNIADMRKSKIVNFKFICLSDSSVLFGIPLINVNTCSMSQFNAYLGFGGFLLDTPVIKLQGFGCLPTG